MLEIPIRLRERLASQRLQLPDTFEGIFDVVPYQYIEKQLPGRYTVSSEHFDGFTNIVPDRTAVVSHAQIAYSFDPCEQPGDLRRANDLPGIESLIEVYTHP